MKGREEPGLPPSEGTAFVVQEHGGRSHHYDLELEVRGTLVTFALPEGPSLDPAVVRTALEVPPAAPSLASFEGVLSPTDRGGGPVLVWDRGTLCTAEEEGDVTAALGRGSLRLDLAGHKLNGRFQLLREERGDTTAEGAGRAGDPHGGPAPPPRWTLRKLPDRFALPGLDPTRALPGSVVSGRTLGEVATLEPWRADRGVESPFPEEVEPMKAVLADAPFDDDSWIFETKFDGIRILAFLGNGQRPVLRSRRGRIETNRYPEVVAALERLPVRAAVLDGEVVTPDEEGRPSFHRLQSRMNLLDDAEIARMARLVPSVYFAFDLIHMNGLDVRGLELVRRKDLLRALLAPAGGAVRYSEHVTGRGVLAFEAACSTGLEGVVGKRADSSYRSGRSPCWVKVKCVREQEFVVCGATPPGGGRAFFGALVLAVAEGSGADGEFRLVYAGKVGTGFDEATLRSLARELDALAVPDPPLSEIPPELARERVRWIRPELVARVRFSSWTPDGRLREPRFLGLRPDVSPADCRREVPVHVGGPSPGPPPGSPPISPDDGAAGGRGPAQFPSRRGLLPPPAPRDVRASLTHPDRVVFPEAGLTRRDLAGYYEEVAPFLLPHLEGRPLVLHRFPEGVGGPSFYMKNAGPALPEWVPTVPVRSATSGRVIEEVVGGQLATVLYLVQLGTISMDAWGSRLPDLDHPDQMFFDLDPDAAPFDRVVATARALREVLDAAGLRSFPKTSGREGLHVYVPLEPVHSHDEVRAFAEAVARVVAARHPDVATVERLPARRRGRVYVDFLQNGYGKTMATAYSVRATPTATVSTPLSWDEVDGALVPGNFTVRTVAGRFRRLGDLFAGALRQGQRLAVARSRSSLPG